MSSLRVGLDVTPVIIGVSGLRHYGSVVWEQLQARNDVQVRPFSVGRGRADRPGVPRLGVPLRAAHLAWRLLSRPTAEGIVGDVDLVHVMDLVPPPTRRPTVVTVMDVIFMTHPDLVSPRNRRLQEAHLEAARRANIVVTGCAATADEIATFSGVDRGRIVVTPYGHRPIVIPTTEDGGSVEPYILSVSTVEPRKGFEDLATAANLIPGCPPVLIAGPDGWQADRVKRRIAAADEANRVRFLGDVRDPVALERLYRKATVVCQPSLAEGFGFPVLEAMGYGAAIVATDIPQTREIAGDCASLVPTADPRYLADALRSLLEDPHARARLGRCALERAQPQTWERMTDHLVAAYHAAVS